MFSTQIREQARLLRLAKKESREWRNVLFTREHYQFLRDFLKKHRVLIIGLLLLLFSQGIIESALIIFSRDQISDGTRLWLSTHFVLLFLVLIGIFLVNSFFAIKYERLFVVLFTNSIRRRIFKHFLGRSSRYFSSDTHANLIAKISYHLPLATLGVSNTFFGFWRWLMYLGIVVLISTISQYHVFSVVGVFVLVSALLFFGGYAVSRLYVSQEVTFYSQIIREMDINTTNISFLNIFRQQDSVLSKFDKLVLFDSFFRIRRDIWMRLGFKMVFIFLVVVSICSHFFPTIFFSFLGTGDSGERFLFILLLIYFSRALHESMRMGLYIFPARLGISLTVFQSSAHLTADTTCSLREKSLGFYSHKTKLFSEGSYHRNIRFGFNPGDRVLFFGSNMTGKTALARLFAGVTAYNPRAIKVTVDAKRFEFTAWQSVCGDVYFFDPNFRTDRTLMECVMGKLRDRITTEEFAEALRIMNRYPSIVDLVSADGNYTVSADTVLRNPLQAFALHALHSLVTGRPVLVIDNFWLDLQYPRIIDMIRILGQALPTSIMLVFANTANDFLPYTQQHELSTKIRPIL